MAGRGQKKCILVSCDEQLFEVPVGALEMSKLIVQLLGEPEHFDPQQLVHCPSFMRNRRIVELPNITASVLAQVIEFCMYHFQNKPFIEIEKPLIQVLQFSDLTTEWDAAFVDKDPKQISELIMAANYLDIKGLMDLCCAKVAWMIMTMEAADVRKSFGIVNAIDPQTQKAWYLANKLFKSCGELDSDERVGEGRQVPEKDHASLRLALKQSRKSFYVPKITEAERVSQDTAAAQTGHMFDVSRALQSKT